MEEIDDKKIRHYKFEIFPVVIGGQPKPDAGKYIMRKIHYTDGQVFSKEYINAQEFDNDYAVRVNTVKDKTHLFFCDGTKINIETSEIDLVSKGICPINNKFYNSVLLADTNVYVYIKNKFTYAIILTRIRKHDIWENKELNKVLDLRISADFPDAANIVYLNSVKKAIADYLHKENELEEKRKQQWSESDRIREEQEKVKEYWDNWEVNKEAGRKLPQQQRRGY